MRWIRLLLIFLALLHGIDLAAQGEIGISLNAGNKAQFGPASPGFKKALSPAGSLFINQTRTVKGQWVVRYGAAAGVIGYSLRVVAIDTLGPGGDIIPFPEYSTLFGSGDVLLGRSFVIGKRRTIIGAGGGATFYSSLVPSSEYWIQVGNAGDNTLVTVFNAAMSAPANRYSLFWKVAIYHDITASLVFGVEYVHHAKPAAHGTYQFHHTRSPQSGDIEVYQREFRLAFSYRLRKWRNT